MEEDPDMGLVMAACEPGKLSQQWVYDSSQGELREAHNAVDSPATSPLGLIRCVNPQERCLEAQTALRKVVARPCDYTHHQR